MPWNPEKPWKHYFPLAPLSSEEEEGEAELSYLFAELEEVEEDSYLLSLSDSALEVEVDWLLQLSLFEFEQVEGVEDLS